MFRNADHVCHILHGKHGILKGRFEDDAAMTLKESFGVKEEKLFVGFKGKNNSSAILVSALSAQSCLLTNSFEGLRKDIEDLPPDYDEVWLFGVDKGLETSVRIERVAEKDGILCSTALPVTCVGDLRSMKRRVHIGRRRLKRIVDELIVRGFTYEVEWPRQMMNEAKAKS